MTFVRGLSEHSMNLLAIEADRRDSWWRCVLDDPMLFVGIRDERVDIYWHGQCVFQASAKSGVLKVTTHEKYLVDPGLKGSVQLSDGKFDLATLATNALIGEFRGPPTLAKMKKAAGYYAGDEKVGCHQAANANPSVIDVEVALMSASGDDPFDRKQSRIDLATMEAAGDGVKLAFWEAKTFSNVELRASDVEPPVIAQMRRYADLLTVQRAEVEASYRRVAANLHEIKNKLGWSRPLSPLVSKVAEFPDALTMGEIPSVRLLVFGFDKDQANGAVWSEHSKKFKAGEAKFIGKASSARL